MSSGFWADLGDEEMARAVAEMERSGILGKNPPAFRPADFPRENPSWRQAVQTAIDEGDIAEAAISDRNFKALSALPRDRLQAILDRKIDEPRLQNMSSDAMKKLRESLGSRRQRVDPAVAASARRARQIGVLNAYVAAYCRQLGHSDQSDIAMILALARQNKSPSVRAVAKQLDAALHELESLKRDLDAQVSE